MHDLTTDRTAPVIAAEINALKYQAGKFLLTSAMEIGRRLLEAKQLVPHGEWGKWLEESFNYSQKTAGKLIRIFDAYGTQELSNLNYTQALILLGIPKEERAEFIVEMDVENMSTRELKKAVSDRSEAYKERDQALKEKDNLQKTLDNQENQIAQISTDRDNLKVKAQQLSNSKRDIETKAAELLSELKSIKKATSYQDVRQMSKKLTEAHNKACANRVAFLYENLDKTLKELNEELKKLADIEPSAHEAYTQKVFDFLTKGLKERAQFLK